LQGASSSTPGVARRGSSHQDSLTPHLENDFQLDWSAAEGLRQPYTRRQGFFSFPKTPCSSSEAPCLVILLRGKTRLARGVWFTSKSVAAEVNMII
jgi:hypothetical protein